MLAIAATVSSLTVSTSQAQAGPWLDAMFGRRVAPTYPVGNPVPIQTANYASYYGSNGVYPPSYGPLLPSGVQQAVPGYLPTASYDTQWRQVPVTNYRPVTQFDPNYGTTVTSLQPCTTYEYQAQRTPLIAPRPLLGEYGYRANRWPAINAPGYNPMGLGYAAPAVPNYNYPAVNQLPNYGLPVSSSAGSSSTVSSSLPIATMNYGGNYGANFGGYYSPSVGLPIQSGLTASATPAYYVAPNGMASTGYSAPGFSNPGTVTSGVMPNGYSSIGPVTASAIQPAYSTYGAGTGTPNYAAPYTTPYAGPNASTYATPYASPSYSGSSVSPNSNMNVPNIPGAVSVVPYGPPTMVPASPSIMPGTNPMPGSNPNSGNILPNSNNSNMVMPPGVRSLNDPESTRAPSLGPSAFQSGRLEDSFSSNVQTLRLPLVTIDRSNESDSSNENNNVAAIRTPIEASSLQWSSSSSNRIEAPSTLPASSQSPLVPLKGSDDLDAKPKWNPKYLDARNPAPSGEPKETAIRTIAERKNVANSKGNETNSGSNGIRFVPLNQPR